MNLRRVWAVVAASVRMFLRDRPAFFFTFAFPIMFMVLFGLIFGAGGTSRPTVDIVGNGPLRQALERSDAIKLKPQPDEAHALEARARRRRAGGRSCCAASSARLVYSATSQVEAPIVIGVVRGIVDGFNLRAVDATAGVRLSSARVEAQSLDYVDLLVPGPAGDGDRAERGLRRGVLDRRVAPEGHAAPPAADAAAARTSSRPRASSSTS